MVLKLTLADAVISNLQEGVKIVLVILFNTNRVHGQNLQITNKAKKSRGKIN